LSSSTTTRAWLFVKGHESVRIVISGSAVAVYGPAGRVTHAEFTEEIDAALHQAAVEQTLVLDGWTLERMTTEHRADTPPAATRPARGTLHAVPPRESGDPS
jgi:hypothetical protein